MSKSDLKYILGIGSLPTVEDCDEILNEMKKRKIDLTQAKQTLEKEISVLDTIEFQTLNRKKELSLESVNPKKDESQIGMCRGCNASNVPIKLDSNNLPKCDDCLAIETSKN